MAQSSSYSGLALESISGVQQIADSFKGAQKVDKGFKSGSKVVFLRLSLQARLSRPKPSLTMFKPALWNPALFLNSILREARPPGPPG